MYIQVLGQIRHQPEHSRAHRNRKVFAARSVRTAALNALQTFSDASIPDAIIGLHDKLPTDVRAAAQSILVS